MNELLIILSMITMSSNGDYDYRSSKSSETVIYNIQSYLKEDLDYNKLLNKIKFETQINSKYNRSLSKRLANENKNIKSSYSCSALNRNSYSNKNRKLDVSKSNSSPFISMNPLNISSAINNDELRYISPSISTISSCFFYDGSFYDEAFHESFGRNNSAKDGKSTIKVKNFFKKIFSKKKSKYPNDKSINDKAPKMTTSNLKLNTNNFLEPTYLNDASKNHPSKLQSNASKKLSVERFSQSVGSVESIDNVHVTPPFSVTKLTVTDELNRTKLVAKSSPEILESYKNVVETTVKSLQSVQDQMVENLKQFYDRGNQLNSLEVKANELQRESSFLQLTTKKVKVAKNRVNKKLLIVACIVLILSLIAIFTIILSQLRSMLNQKEKTR